MRSIFEQIFRRFLYRFLHICVTTDDVFEGSLEYTVPDSDWNVSVETQIQGSYFLIETFEMNIEDQKFNLLQ